MLQFNQHFQLFSASFILQPSQLVFIAFFLLSTLLQLWQREEAHTKQNSILDTLSQGGIRRSSSHASLFITNQHLLPLILPTTTATTTTIANYNNACNLLRFMANILQARAFHLPLFLGAFLTALITSLNAASESENEIESQQKEAEEDETTSKRKEKRKKNAFSLQFLLPSASLPSPPSCTPSSSSFLQLRQQLLTDFYGCLTVIKAIKRFDSHLIDARVCATETASEGEMRHTAFS